MQRHLMARAVVATAVLALGVLMLFELNFASGRATQARPAVLSIEEALVQLRSQQAAGQTASPGLAPTTPASLDVEKDAYGRSTQALDAAWAALSPEQSDRLTQAQRLWIWKRNAACEAAPRGGGDPATREVGLLTCKGDANQQRAAWLKQYAAQAAPSTEASAGASSLTTAPVLGPAEACAWMHDRAAHLGQTLSFQGEYLDDHGGPALVRPIGCDQAIVLREMDPAARMTLDQIPPPSAFQTRRLVALFTARLVHAGVVVSDDDAIRLHVAQITNVQVVSGR